MSITVSDCLQLPTLSKATVVAGNGGLNKEVYGISVLETSKVIQNKNSYVGNGGELVVTGFITCYDDVESIVRCIQSFSNGSDAGLIIFYLGIYIKEIPKEVCELADKLDFPVIVMPKNCEEIPYSYVIYEVMELILKNKLKANGYKKDVYELESSFVTSILDKDRMSIHRLSLFIDDRPEDIIAMRIIPIEDFFISEAELLSKVRDYYKNNNITAYTSIYKDAIVVLISRKSKLAQDDVEKLWTYIQDGYNNPIIVQIEELNSLKEIVNMHNLYISTIKEAKSVFRTKDILNKHELLFVEQSINMLKVGSQNIKYYMSLINKIERSDTNLYETLEKYLIDYNSNITLTSENMFLHKNTIQYRLNKIKEILGNNVFEFPIINQLIMVIAIKRIQNKI
ncbi:MAG: PucR family transcriptional regulator [Peptostreptococcaceae bacterium]